MLIRSKVGDQIVIKNGRLLTPGTLLGKINITEENERLLRCLGKKITITY